MVIALAALNLALAVLLGAFGAHGLKAKVTPEQLAWWHTGIDYHVYHALGMLLIGVLMAAQPQLNLAKGSVWTLQFGIIVFSGSLYAMTLGAPRWFGAITPIGGTAFIVAWLWLAYSAWQRGI
ncbi:DUF423 domain-containing protein [Agitococcus lubricus]|uniref:Uncharacterized membrane protein YgdD (TMEM256/DUF423 family) n=1 Tax=Agitococcus lubricus TaxID=1077255 RepID=A0A2T5IZH7_9GAMM|nr:DUF423 domain-containing protein [Agitococcus lubricus]PTQ89402.1 uncharacterized membrane protein YgdD (TMEM256/DUF423 family) [Agitococcus lubricus]